MLESYDEIEDELTTTDLEEIFILLSKHYKNDPESKGKNSPKIIDMKLEEIKKAYKLLAQVDETMGSPFEQRNNWTVAKISDIAILIEKLIEHY